MTLADPSRRVWAAVVLGAVAIGFGLGAGAQSGVVVARIARTTARATATDGTSPRGRTASPRRGRAIPRQPGAVASPLAAARQFLAGYLQYSYGRQTPLPAATAALRRSLLGAPPGVPRAIRRRRPRLVSLILVALDAAHRRALAVVADGAAPYDVELDVAETSGRWLVDAVDPGS